MKTLFAFLLSCLTCAAAGVSGRYSLSGLWRFTTSFPADTFQDFHAGTNGTVVTTQQLTNSAIGIGSWSILGPVSYSNFTVAPLTLSQPVSVGGQLITTTGTNAVRVYHGSVTETTNYLSMLIPGGDSNGSYSNMLVRAMIGFFETNTTITDNNLDHLIIYGNDFCVCQQQISSGGNQLKAHTNGHLGPPVDITPGYYEVRLLRDARNAMCSMVVFDQNGNFVGSSSAQMGSLSSSFWTQSTANYLNLGDITGYTEKRFFAIQFIP